MFTATRRKFTLEEYHRLGELEFFNPDERVELIRGEIIQMPFKKTLHSVCNTRLWKEVNRLIGERVTLRIQEPIVLPADSEPQPDLVIARNQNDDYLSSHPHPEDILLVIEISDSTLKYDQQTKLPLYAEDGIQEYWIFNLIARHVEVYSQPYQEQNNQFNYRIKRIYLPNESILLPGFPNISLDLSPIFF